VAIIEYARRPNPDPQLSERLESLARPSLGHWWEFVRRLVSVLADQDAAFTEVRDLLLGRRRDDCPRAAGLDAALREALEVKGGSGSTVSLTELFDRLVRYRNQELGHGAAGQRKGDFYDRMGRALLAGVAEVLGKLNVLAGRRLLYVGEVQQKGGRWLVQRYELIGEAARGIEPLELPLAAASALPVAERLYLDRPAGAGTGAGPVVAAPPSLHPLVIYEAEAEEVLFLNSRHGRQRTEYLCYTTGRKADRPDLGGEQRELLARVLGMAVAEEQAVQWAAQAQAEEPAEEPAGEAGQPAGVRRTLGEFELLSELGRGGMGVVYRAWQPSLGRQVALKKLLHSGDAKTEARFRREIRSLGRVEHPHVVKVFTSGSDGDDWFYAMELIEGTPLSAVCDKLQSRGGSVTDLELHTWHETLSTVCAESRHNEKQLSDHAPVARAPAPASGTSPVVPVAGRSYVRHIVALLQQVADAAHVLHEAGVVHRDIKPGNILVTADGTQAVLMDLGLAQLADDEDGRLTRTRQFVGTLRYASPEQVLAVGKADRRSDIYALGATLWELLTLRPLYGATDQTPTAELMQRIQYEEVGSCRKDNPRVSRDLEAVVLKCLEKDPRRRYATAKELADELGRYLAGEPVQARPAGVVRRTVRKIKRRPARVLGALALVALLGGLALGGWYWDARRTKVEYYLAHTSRWGAPEGVGRVSEEEAHHRSTTWKFTRQKGLVVKMEAVNGSGLPTTSHDTSALLHRSGEEVRECCFEYPRDDKGQVRDEVALDRQGQVVWTFHYSTPTTGYFTDKRGLPRARSGTGAAFVEYVYTPEGFQGEVHYLDTEGRPQANHEKIFGSRREFDERGLIIAVTALDAQGQPVLKGSGYARYTWKYDERGNQTELAYFGLDDQPALHKDGYAKVARKYDEHGNVAEVATFGLDGQPVVQKGGYAKFTSKYDEHGNLTEQACFGVDGQSVLNKDGHAKVAMKYDERANRIETAFFGLDGRPTLLKDGFAKVAMKYDERGNKTEVAYFGLDGQPVLLKDGYAKGTWKYDERANLTEEAYFGLDGQPVLYKDGYARFTAKYDERGNRTEEAYFGLDGKAALRKAGEAKMTWKYDERGNKTEEAYFGVDGLPILQKDGIAGFTAKYDERGNRTEEAYFGLDGRPILQKDGIARFTAKFDARGNGTEQAYFGLGGQPVLDKEGYARITRKYDERGNIIETAYLGVDGQPTLHKDGNARYTAKYDERGNRTEQSYFGLDGQPVLHKDGYARYTAKYDERGNETEEAYFGLDGQPVLVKDGYARVTMKYDARGNEIERAYFGVDGQPTLHNDGNAKLTWKYDDRSNKIEEAYFGLDGQPIALADGYAKVAMKYDARGNRIEQAYFGVDGRPVLNKDGHAKVSWKFDERGNKSEATFFGLDGSKVAEKFDARGNVTEVAYFGVDGQPVLHKDGNAKVTWKYDARGNQTEGAYFGVNGQPILLKDGYAKFTAKYDARGNVTEVAYFGADGQPVLDKEGFAKFTMKYDERGNKIEAAFFGLDGQPALHKEGNARYTAKFDERGNKTEEAYFGLDGRPTLLKDGYARFTAKYDERGNIVEKSYFGLDGQPTLHKDGYAKVAWKYDERGNQIDATYYDLAGKPVRVRTKVTSVVPDSQATRLGVMAGDILVSYGGKEITNYYGFDRRGEHPGDAPKELRVLRGDKMLTFPVAPGRLGVDLRDEALPEAKKSGPGIK